MSDHEPPHPAPSTPPIQPPPPPIGNQPYGQPGGYAQTNQPYGQPGQYPLPGQFDVPPKKKRKIWPWVLAAVLIPMLLIGGCAVAIFRSAKGPVDASNQFLSRIDDGDFDKALELVDQDCFADGSLPEIEAFFTEQDLTSYDLDGTFVSGNSGTATGTITMDNTDPRAIEFTLTKNDGWKICGLEIDE
jgi:hypothetical protein